MDETLYFEHDELEETYWWFLGRRAIVASVLRQFLGGRQAARRILDIGCGTGGMLRILHDFGEAIGVDSTQYAIARAKQKTGCRVEEGQLPDGIPFSPGSFDVVTAFDVIEHIDDDIRALKSIWSLLAQEGLFVCTVPAMPFLWSIHDDLNQHKRRYTKRELYRKIEAAGFKVMKISYYNFLLFPLVLGVRLTGKLFRRKGSDFTVAVVGMNDILRIILSTERLLINFLPFPIGVSLLAVARKRGVD